MTRKVCPQGHTVDLPDATHCPFCGAPLQQAAPESPERTRRRRTGILALVVFIVLGSVAFAVHSLVLDGDTATALGTLLSAAIPAPTRTPTAVPCLRQSDPYVTELYQLLGEWDDVRALASSTSRIALSGVVQDMQALRRRASAMKPPRCADLAHTYLLKHMGATIDLYLAFMAQEPDSVVSEKANEAADYARWFREQIERLSSSRK